ncbi:MAG: hypothetical protein Q9184_005989 [Pyrenodesmia sp. 2 TL-2023]
MNFIEGESDGSPWVRSNETGEYYKREWDGEQGQWVTVWKPRISTNALQDEINIVKDGHVYRELDPFEEEALQKFVSGRLAGDSFQPRKNQATMLEATSNDLVYEPLTKALDMRIVQLSPGNFDEEIECILHHCSVGFEYPVDPTRQVVGSGSLTFLTPTFHAVSNATGAPMWYTALSYVWGDPAFVESIRCNGKAFRTTKNLYIALKYLRRTDVAVNLWIDQICINQNDLEEKTHQVVLMSKIYQRAWSTIVWLGEEADNSRNAHDAIRAVNEALQYHTAEGAPTTEDFERLALPVPGSPAWYDVGKLLGRPWFQRLWIIQEAVLSHDVRFICGRVCIPWKDLSIFAICMIDNDLGGILALDVSAEHEAHESGLTRIRMIDRMIDYEWTHPRQSALLGALVDGRGSRATDPRDKVFGIMGMTATPLHPDYTSPVTEIYTEAARKILHAAASNLIDLLHCVDHEQPPTQLPSWVPDWSVPRQTASLGYLGRSQGVHQTAKDSEIEWEYRPNDLALNISGFCCDTISRIGPLADFVLTDLIVRESPTHRFVMECMHQITEYCQKQPNQSSLFEAFWQTLVAGKDHSNVQKAPLDYAAIFSLLIDTATGHSPSFPDQPNFKRKLTLANLEVRRPSILYRQMQIAFKAAVKGRRFGTTTNGCIGLYPRGTKIGDRVCVFSGGHVPFVLRWDSKRDSYQLVGECYQHGIMDGEVMCTTEFAFHGIKVK